MLHITVTYYSVKSFCQPSVSQLVTRSHFSRTMLRFIERVIQCSICLKLSTYTCFHPTVVMATTGSGACHRDKSSVPESTLSTALSSVLSKSRRVASLGSQNHGPSCSTATCETACVCATLNTRCGLVNNFPIM